MGLVNFLVYIKNKLKRVQIIRNLYYLLITLSDFFKFKPASFVKKFIWYLVQFFKYKKMECNPKFKKMELYPCLLDNIGYTPIEPTYFFQDCWTAKHIFELKPTHHYDIGSSVKTMGILSQFVPITFVDIRPIEVELPNFFFKKGSILALPFEDCSIESISCLCVIEHIGLGRYGDPLDPFGSEKAIKELTRVLKEGGILLISVPVDEENKIYFNAHRAFTRDYLLELFCDYEILDEKYIYGNKMYNDYDPAKGFGTGLFKLKKRSRKCM
jgi:SAM-dependent methyltransferase